MIDPGVREQVNDAITVVARFANSRHLAAVHSAQSGVDLPLSAVALLRQLDPGNPLRLSELSRRLQVALPPLSRQVRTLVDSGFLERAEDGSDARASLLAITEAGREALRRFEDANRALLDKALAGWDDESLAALASQMQRLVEDLRRGGPDGNAVSSIASGVLPAHRT
ncbi:MAG TPA: MarR family transcriptional regulator [Frankiaceae bacterium]|nr:MarR family transcriptional regulator [Frankiaceae bacterium]